LAAYGQKYPETLEEFYAIMNAAEATRVRRGVEVPRKGAAAPSPPAMGLAMSFSSRVRGAAPTAQRFSTVFSTQDGLS